MEQTEVQTQTESAETKPTEQTEPATQTEPASAPAEPDSKVTEYESALREIFEIADGEEIGDLKARISEMKQKYEAVTAAANDKLITAAVNSLEGYDTKLLLKLINREKITVGDDGTVTGAAEAAKAVAEEFPAVVMKKEQQKKPFVPLNTADNQPTAKTMNDLIRRK